MQTIHEYSPQYRPPGDRPGVINTASNGGNPAPTTTGPSGSDGSSGYQAETINQDDSNTVEGRVKSIIERSGPALQSEVTRATQDANSKGILNSSMAIGANERARYDYAVPIASTDAEIGMNIDIANAGAINDASQFGADASNRVNEIRVGGEEDRENIGYQTDADMRRDAGLADIEKDRDLRLADIESTRDAELARIKEEEDYRLGDIQLDRDNLLADLDAGLKELDNELAIELEGVLSDNRNVIEATRAAGLLYAQTSASISEILSNPEITSSNKTGLVAQQTALLRNGLAIITDLTDVNVDDILDFGQDGGGGGSAGSIPTSWTDVTGADVSDKATEAELAMWTKVGGEGDETSWVNTYTGKSVTSARNPAEDIADSTVEALDNGSYTTEQERLNLILLRYYENGIMQQARGY